jgi:predicted HTH transcriptional regulator
VLDIPLDKVDASYLQELCDRSEEESQTLDFKQTLPGKEDKDKTEFAKDVCAFANADGGTLIYGIAEADGKASKVLAIQGIKSSDIEQRRLRSIVASRIEPPVTGISMRIVEMQNGLALLLQVPASFDGPHCVKDREQRRFVIRNGAGTSDMTYEQIRTAFDRNATLTKKANEFVGSRRAMIATRATSPTLATGACVYLQYSAARRNGWAHY